MEARLDEANGLVDEGRIEEALEVLREALDEAPDHAGTNFAYASLLDGLGREREAIPRYKRAVAAGLSGEELQEATVNLGSSYRVVGEPGKAVEVLSRFPENRAARVFLAMALHDLGEPGRAMEILLRELAETSSDRWISSYGRAIAEYAELFGRDTPR